MNRRDECHCLISIPPSSLLSPHLISILLEYNKSLTIDVLWLWIEWDGPIDQVTKSADLCKSDTEGTQTLP